MEKTMKPTPSRIKSIAAVLAAVICLQTAAHSETRKIAVLPFDKLNKEKNDELDTLVTGISETLSGALSTVDEFIIIDTNRIKRHILENAEFKQAIGEDYGKDMDKLREIAAGKLETDYIIYGSFQKIGNQIQINAKFMDVKTGKIMSGVSVYGRYPDEIFMLQEKLAREIMAGITGRPADQGNKISDYTSSTDNYDAYQCYIKGRAEQVKYNISSYARAVDYYTKALKFDPGYALAWAGLSEVHALWGFQVKYARGDWKPYLKLAVEEGRKAVKFGPTLYQAHRALAMSYLNNAEFGKSQESADEAYRLNSRDAETLQIMAQLKNFGYKEMAREGTESNRYIIQALEIDPELIIARWSLAHSYSMLGENKKAIGEFMKILAINPEHAPSLNSIALIYYDEADYSKCLEFALRAVKADPGTAHHHYILGLAYYRLNKADRAESALNDAIAIYPEYTEAIICLGHIYRQKQEHSAAIKLYQKALKNEPNNIEANFSMGLTYYDMKSWNQALFAFEKTVSFDPKHREAWNLIAACYRNLGQWEKAYNSYNRVLELEPGNSEARKLRDDSYNKWKSGK